ncbi:MAG: hypothetical protein KJ583_05980 [Nanoarchaeota archaeon]|nr:hypothetical protein [Nanoarchaeota archaeon]MBU1270250.1 hypothetical protein [Nanoarchaeota archaeon]MBU1604834.1 hypothetical protein [Nanoarchaeota archaeon]MBU2442496.1 hypothetical protein [Nanoarchaeota archaeon]
MVTKNGGTVGHTMVKYKGDYDFDGLYKLISRWIIDRKYKFDEKRYKDKIDNPMGTEVEIDFTGLKKETPYVVTRIKVSIHAWNYKEKEGILHEEKTRFTGGRVTVTIDTDIIFDWQAKFRGSKIKELMGDFYFWIRKKELEATHVDNQEYEALRLEHEIKKFLRMETDTHAY